MSAAGAGDLDVLSAVTSEDFWEGAYRLERETRIRAQEVGVQLRAGQAAMVARLKSFLFEKALDLNEDELNAVLMFDNEGLASGASACSLPSSSSCVTAGPEDNSLGEFSVQIRAADGAADDLLQERGLYDEEEEDQLGGNSAYDGCDDDSLLLQDEELKSSGGQYSPVPSAVSGNSLSKEECSSAVATPSGNDVPHRQPPEQSFFV